MKRAQNIQLVEFQQTRTARLNQLISLMQSYNVEYDETNIMSCTRSFGIVSVLTRNRLGNFEIMQSLAPGYVVTFEILSKGQCLFCTVP